MSDLAAKVTESIGKWQPATYLGILCCALLVVVAFDKIQAWRGGDPDHTAIRSQLSDIAVVNKNMASVNQQNATTNRMQALAIRLMLCTTFGPVDSSKQVKCYNDYESDLARLNAEIDRGQR